MPPKIPKPIKKSLAELVFEHRHVIEGSFIGEHGHVGTLHFIILKKIKSKIIAQFVKLLQLKTAPYFVTYGKCTMINCKIIFFTVPLPIIT